MTDNDAPVSNASLDDAANAHLPSPASGWSALTDRVIIRVTGPGTDQFLQGQFSQNLTEVTAGHSPRAAASTPKGRAYCLTRMVRDGEDILFDLPASLADTTLEQLKKYLMLFRGTSANKVNEGVILGLYGAETAQTIAGNQLAELKEPGDSLSVEQGWLIRVEPTAEGLARFELWCPNGQPTLAEESEHSLANWHATDIAAGIASLSEQTQGEFVPQMLNWQHLGGVHFKKGCYTGQEVIARMHFLGQLKKSLYRFRLAQAPATPAPGEAVLSGERSVGTVVNAVRFDNGSCELLAVVRHDAAPGTLRIESAPAQELEPRPLSYEVPEQNSASQTDT